MQSILYRGLGWTSIAVCSLMVAACGGGSDPAPTPTPTPNPSPTDQQRTQAATQTAQTNSQCTAIQPFYWEIGDANAMRAGGTAGGTTPTSATVMKIASASKWIFGSYVVQLRNGALTANDIAALTMKAGYTNFTYGSCVKLSPAVQAAETVHACFVEPRNLGSGNNNDFNAAHVGKFFYNGGHFQWLADSDLALGATTNATLATALATQLGSDWSLAYDSPQLAAGVKTSGSDYGFFLRKILSNQLRMRDALGTNAVCTNPLTCPAATTVSTPIPTTESWHYSLGHWVEVDPIVGDGAFSSPGAFGFYPWIDATKTYYGVLAREDAPSGIGDSIAAGSVNCGRLIRKAWVTATAQ